MSNEEINETKAMIKSRANHKTCLGCLIFDDKATSSSKELVHVISTDPRCASCKKADQLTARKVRARQVPFPERAFLTYMKDIPNKSWQGIIALNPEAATTVGLELRHFEVVIWPLCDFSVAVALPPAAATTSSSSSSSSSASASSASSSASSASSASAPSAFSSSSSSSPAKRFPRPFRPNTICFFRSAAAWEDHGQQIRQLLQLQPLTFFNSEKGEHSFLELFPPLVPQHLLQSLYYNSQAKSYVPEANHRLIKQGQAVAQRTRGDEEEEGLEPSSLLPTVMITSNKINTVIADDSSVTTVSTKSNGQRKRKTSPSSHQEEKTEQAQQVGAGSAAEPEPEVEVEAEAEAELEVDPDLCQYSDDEDEVEEEKEKSVCCNKRSAEKAQEKGQKKCSPQSNSHGSGKSNTCNKKKLRKTSNASLSSASSASSAATDSAPLMQCSSGSNPVEAKATLSPRKIFKIISNRFHPLVRQYRNLSAMNDATFLPRLWLLKDIEPNEFALRHNQLREYHLFLIQHWPTILNMIAKQSLNAHKIVEFVRAYAYSTIISYSGRQALDCLPLLDAVLPYVRDQSMHHEPVQSMGKSLNYLREQVLLHLGHLQRAHSTLLESQIEKMLFVYVWECFVQHRHPSRNSFIPATLDLAHLTNGTGNLQHKIMANFVDDLDIRECAKTLISFCKYSLELEWQDTHPPALTVPVATMSTHSGSPLSNGVSPSFLSQPPLLSLSNSTSLPTATPTPAPTPAFCHFSPFSTSSVIPTLASTPCFFPYAPQARVPIALGTTSSPFLPTSSTSSSTSTTTILPHTSAPIPANFWMMSTAGPSSILNLPLINKPRKSFSPFKIAFNISEGAEEPKHSPVDTYSEASF